MLTIVITLFFEDLSKKALHGEVNTAQIGRKMGVSGKG